MGRVADGGVAVLPVVRSFPYIFYVVDVAIAVGGLALAPARARPARSGSGAEFEAGLTRSVGRSDRERALGVREAVQRAP